MKKILSLLSVFVLILIMGAGCDTNPDDVGRATENSGFKKKDIAGVITSQAQDDIEVVDLNNASLSVGEFTATTGTIGTLNVTVAGEVSDYLTVNTSTQYNGDYALTVDGDAYISNTTTVQDLVVNGSSDFGVITVSSTVIAGACSTSSPNFTGLDTDTGFCIGTDEIAIITSSTANIFINNLGYMGIGTSNPQVPLHFVDGAGVVPTLFGGVQFLLQNNTDSYDNSRMNLLSGANGEGIFNFGDTNDSDIGGLSYNHATDSFGIRTNNVNNRITIASDGKVGIGTSTPMVKTHIYMTDVVDGLFLQNPNHETRLWLGEDGGPTGHIGELRWDNDINALKILTTNGVEYENTMVLRDGNVGIGTISPSTTLHLDGTLGYVPSTDTAITAAGGITITKAVQRVAGNGGAIDITADPQIADGADGQIVTIQGTNDTNTVKLDDGTGLSLNGGVSFTMGANDTISLMYDSGEDLWVEVYGRNDNS